MFSQLSFNIDNTLKQFNIELKYNVYKQDLFHIDKQYDIIIVKSVLGSITRTSGLTSTRNLIQSICKKNLNDDGFLITLDNGVPFYNKLLSKLGSRKKRWFFFKKGIFYYMVNNIISVFVSIFI